MISQLNVVLARRALGGAMLMVGVVSTGHGVIEVSRDAWTGVMQAKERVVERLAESQGMEKPKQVWTREAVERVLLVKATKHRIAPNVARGLAHVESKFNPLARSKKDARGVVQVMPFNAKKFGHTPDEMYDPEIGSDVGLHLLSLNIEEQRGDVFFGLVEYNGGPTCVRVVKQCGNNTACMGDCDESYNLAHAVMNFAARDVN